MSVQRRYSWIVTLMDGSVLQVDADEIEYPASGHLVFWDHTIPEGKEFCERGGKDRDYVCFTLAAGQWRYASIMSQMTGYENGHSFLKQSDAAKMAAEIEKPITVRDVKRERPERRSLSQKLRFDVFERDGFKCRYCGDHGESVKLHCDHVVPVSKGGSNDIANLVTACEDCNQGKGARLLTASAPARNGDGAHTDS